jgi:hypothetical protein
MMKLPIATVLFFLLSMTLSCAESPSLKIYDKKIQTPAWCGDAQTNKVSIDTEKLVIGLAGDHPRILNVNAIRPHSQCVMSLGLDLWELPDGYRFTFTDLRWSTHIETENGGYIQEFTVTTSLDEITQNDTRISIEMVSIAIKNRGHFAIMGVY